MKIIYTAGRFRGATPYEVHCNVARAEAAALEIAEAGAMPLCPHMNTKNFDGLLTPDFWIEGTKELLRRSDAIYIFDTEWRTSKGTVGELVHAVSTRMPVFWTRSEVEYWCNHEDVGGYRVSEAQLERLLA